MNGFGLRFEKCRVKSASCSSVPTFAIATPISASARLAAFLPRWPDLNFFS